MSALSRIRHDHRRLGHCPEFSVCQQSSELASSLRNILPSQGGIPEIICIRFITTQFSQTIIEQWTNMELYGNFILSRCSPYLPQYELQLPFILNLMSIKNLTMFLILAQNWSQLISTQRWHSTIRVNLTLKRSEPCPGNLSLTVTEVSKRPPFWQKWLGWYFLQHFCSIKYSSPWLSPAPALAQAVFIKCHDWSDCYWSLCPHPWLVEPGTSSSLIATEHCSVLQVTSHGGLSNLRASSYWFNPLFGKFTKNI